MSSSRLDNSGSFHSAGIQVVGNSINTSGGDVHFHPPNTIGDAKSFQLGLHFGNAPLIDTDLFVGRSSELCSIHNFLHPPDSLPELRCIVVGGIGGVGKTQLAIAYARQYRQFYDSIFWLSADTELSVHTSLQQVARLLVGAADVEKLSSDQISNHIHGWLSNSSNTRWLLVFDNYDDPQNYDIRKYWPYTAHGSIVVTTRVPDLVSISNRKLRLQPLRDIEEGLQILETRSHRPHTSTDLQARRLAERLAGFPLALATAGAYLRKTTLTFEQYLQAYEQRFNVNPRRPIQLQEYSSTLYATWNLSYRQIENDDPYAAKVLGLLAYFDHQEVWFDLLRAGITGTSPEWLQEVTAEHIDFENVMGTLVDYCLLETHPTRGSYSLHSCVHDWTLGELNQDIDYELYWYAFDCVVGSIDQRDWEILGRVKNTRIGQHGVRLTQPRFSACEKSDTGLLARLNKTPWIVKLLYDQAQFFAAEQMCVRIKSRTERIIRQDEASMPYITQILGRTYIEQGRLDEAEQLMIRVLAGCKRELGPEHTSTLDAMHELGYLYHA